MTSGLELTLEIVQHDTAAAVRLLARRPGVTRIWLFGSVAKGRPLDWRSDLDLAVEGLAASDQGRAWAELDEALTLPVDLIRWETAAPSLRDEIARWGKVLHEA
jgi:predicted nucleotidyltransferase